MGQYERLRYAALYPNVDVIYHPGKQGRLEHDFVVQPGGDPSRVRMAFPGARAALAGNGELVIRSGRVRLVEKRPVIYQDTANGRKEIARRILSGGHTANTDSESALTIAPCRW